MALSKDALEVISPYIRNAKILSFGYPDLLLNEEETKGFGVTPTKFNSGAWHKRKHPLPETVEFFSQLGSTIDCIDSHASRGFERIVDLNDPQDLGQYDLVIDAGTIEHCANVGQALMTAAKSVKVGGHVFHIPPMTMVNHGFYNICPTLLHDFYEQNGWRIEYLTGFGANGAVQVSPTQRMKFKNEKNLVALMDLWMFFLAKKNGEGLKWPRQSKYLENPNL